MMITTISLVIMSPYKVIQFFLAIRTFQIYSILSNMQYSVINYIFHAVYYISMTYLFYKWKLITL